MGCQKTHFVYIHVSKGFNEIVKIYNQPVKPPDCSESQINIDTGNAFAIGFDNHINLLRKTHL